LKGCGMVPVSARDSGTPGGRHATIGSFCGGYAGSRHLGWLGA
jgi:hypothetical protein